MDRSTITTSVAEFLILTRKVEEILSEYISGTTSALEDAQNLQVEITALIHVLRGMVTFLRSDNVQGYSFHETSILRSVISNCQCHVEYLYRKLENLSCIDNGAKVLERLNWPLTQSECQKIVEALHRNVQTFEFSISISNWFTPRILCLVGSLFANSHSALISENIHGLEEMHRKWKQTVECVSQMIGEVPDKLSQFSKDISIALRLVSTNDSTSPGVVQSCNNRVTDCLRPAWTRAGLAKSLVSTTSGEMQSSFSGVQFVQRKWEGCQQSPVNYCSTLTTADYNIKKHLQRLSPLEPQKRHQDVRQKRLESTGGWLLEMAEFRTWRDCDDRDHNSVLVCYGIAGSGKTVIRCVHPDRGRLRNGLLI
jgi:hypothetical protein